jgi:hypothetical protein
VVEQRAAKQILAPAESVFSAVGTVEDQVRLFGERAELVGAGPGGPRVLFRGPLGLRRTVTVEHRYAKPPEAIVGRAYRGRSRASVRWSIQRAEPGSWVQVTAQIDAVGLVDSILLRLGGRAWLSQSLALALEHLDARMPRGEA